jgi:hypothetical protein
MAALSLILLGAGIWALVFPWARCHHWTDATPTTILILTLPWSQPPDGSVAEEIRERAQPRWINGTGSPPVSSLWGWQRRMLAARAAPMLRSSGSQQEQWAILILNSLGPDAAAAVPELIVRLDAVPPGNDYAAMMPAMLIKRIGADAASAVPALARRLKAQKKMRAGICEALNAIGPACIGAENQLLAVFATGDREEQAASARALGRVSASSVQIRAAMIEAMSGENAELRAVAAEALKSDAVALSHAISHLSEFCNRGDSRDRAGAALGLRLLGPAAGPAVPAIVSCLDDPDPMTRYAGAWALQAIGPGASAVWNRLEALAESDSDGDVRTMAAAAAESLGPRR